MKTILIPTDYSDVSINSLYYAVDLARFCEAQLVLLHVYQIPVPTGDVPFMMMVPQDLEQENRERIRELEKKIIERTEGDIRIDSLVRAGFPVEEIQNVIKERNIDLVVMGITGGGEISERLIGSHTSSLIKQTQTPVLIVPKEARYKTVEKIVLAYDHHEDVNVATLEKFKKIMQLLDAKVLVLEVAKHVTVPMDEDSVAEKALENSLKDIEHVMFFSAAEDLTEEINSFADFHECDWVAMIPHKHNILRQLFHESNTKRMVFHTHMPLLSIHD